MRALLLVDTFVTVFFALGIVFFAKTLPWPWAVALSIPVVAAYLVYRKLGRVEASMNETVREYETFFSDKKTAVWGVWLALIVIGGLLIFGLSGNAELLPINETSVTLNKINQMAGEVESIRKTMEQDSAKRDKQAAELVEAERATAASVNSLEGKTNALKAIETNSAAQTGVAEKNLQILEKMERTLLEMKEILARMEEVKNEGKK